MRTFCSVEPCFSLIECLQTALCILDPDHVGGRVTNHDSVDLLTSSDNSTENWRVGDKRHIHDVIIAKTKRHKIDEESLVLDSVVAVEHKTHTFNYERKEQYADIMRASLLSFVELLDSPVVKPSSLRPDVALTALSMLCIAFSKYPWTSMSICIFRKMYAWIPWVWEQVCLDL